MTDPVLAEPFRAAPDVHVITSHVPVPGLGILNVNSFLVEGAEPTLIDAGVPVHREGFLEALWSLIDPGQLSWVALTHDDPDHIGSLFSILEAAQNARLLTNFASFGRLNLTEPIPPKRVHLINAWERVSVGDRTLTAVQPPLFDNPGTVGFYDDRSQILFSSDCFGGVLPSMNAAELRDAADIPAETLTQGQALWATMESPWVHHVDRDLYAGSLERIHRIEPAAICSTHLPPVRGRTRQFVDTLTGVPDAEVFVPPNQRDLEEMLST
jgi:glyoxylase-like metal-dependent hydrolase (beta-lactamase superfamily II)